jgi:CDP-diacylglycerol--serine O-phosphatidyltransferase
MKLFNLPNAITLANLFCGCIAIVLLITTTEFFPIAILTMLSLLFDFADGLVARLLKIQSEIGKQLDSLADMVSFGVVPGLVMVKLIGGNEFFSSFQVLDYTTYIPLIGLLISLFSALRLAKFNLDETQTENFKGLATPANTILILALALSSGESFGYLDFITNNKYLLIGLTVVSSLLLVSDIPMFSFKFKNFSWKKNSFRYILIFSTIILLGLFHFTGIFLLITWYIILSIITKKQFS